MVYSTKTKIISNENHGSDCLIYCVLKRNQTFESQRRKNIFFIKREKNVQENIRPSKTF